MSTKTEAVEKKRGAPAGNRNASKETHIARAAIHFTARLEDIELIKRKANAENMSISAFLVKVVKNWG